MKIRSLIEVVTAAHFAKHVEGEFKEYGGIMLVAPPGSFKTTVINYLNHFASALVVSDINVQQLMELRTRIAQGLYTTLAFTEFEKLYQRQDSTAANVQGVLKAMTAEGFTNASFENQTLKRRRARCLVIGAVTDDLYLRKFESWHKDGFARRFIWSSFQLKDPQIVIEAVHRWKPLQFSDDSRILQIPPYGFKVPNLLTDAESRELEKMLPRDEQFSAALILLKKIACFLRWRYPSDDGSDYAFTILRDFAESTRPGREPAELELDNLSAPLMPLPVEGIDAQKYEHQLLRKEVAGFQVPELLLSGRSRAVFVPPVKRTSKAKKESSDKGRAV